jgi:hypothetical protein
MIRNLLAILILAAIAAPVLGHHSDAADFAPNKKVIDKNGETAMHGAAYKHGPSVVRLLAARGAKIDVWNHPNKYGWTPLRIVEGIPIGMNIAGDDATKAVIQELLASGR